MNRKERWRPVAGYEHLYWVSDRGRVERIWYPRRPDQPPRLLNPSPRDGYMFVCMSRDGVQHTARVHRLVIEAFEGPCPDGMQVNHKDGDKANNELSNLEYVTAKQNIRHAERLGLRRPPRGESHGNSKLTANEVRAIRKARGTNAEVADRFNTSATNVSVIRRRVAWQHIA